MKSPHQKYSVVNIEFLNQAEADQFSLEKSDCAGQMECRGSGISTTSHDLNYAFLYNDTVTVQIQTTANRSEQYGDGHKRQFDLNANDGRNEQIPADPPPIPRKIASPKSQITITF